LFSVSLPLMPSVSCPHLETKFKEFLLLSIDDLRCSFCMN
jgi:hypothetical protein